MAKLSKTAFISGVQDLFPDNTTEQISPLDLRTVVLDAADSTALFLVDENIHTANFSTSGDSRTTRIGQFAWGDLGLVGRTSADDTAVGYYSMGQSYQTERNVAVGAYSLGCNLYGSYNTAVGYAALAGKLQGSGNVGIGPHTLQGNKNGNFNIAIGYGAGYYVGTDDSYKFYLASVPVDSGTLCGTVVGQSPRPLLYGDLSGIQLAVGATELHDYGVLQVSGGVSPSVSNAGGLGDARYPWNGAFVNSGISFDTTYGDFQITRFDGSYAETPVMFVESGGAIGFNTNAPSGTLGLVTVNGNVLPLTSMNFSLGNENLLWDGWFNDVTISGVANINNATYNNVSNNSYEAKTLHLAASGLTSGGPTGPVQGYLNDAGLDGAGFIAHASGSDYQRDYKFIYSQPDVSLTCLETDSAFSRSHWQSNISIEVLSGRHVKTRRILSDADLSLVSQSGCYGFFYDSETGKTFVAPETYKSSNGLSSDFTFTHQEPASGYIATIATSGTDDLALQFVSQSATTPKAAILRYIDASGLVIQTSGSPQIDHTTFYFSPHPDSGVVAFNNMTPELSRANGFDTGYASMQVFSSGDAKIRVGSVDNNKSVGIEFVQGTNTESPLADIVLNTTDSSLDVSVSGNKLFKFAESGVLEMKVGSGVPAATAGFGAVFVRPSGGNNTLFFVDENGVENPFIRDENVTTDGLVYSDASGNVAAGANCPVSRPIGNSNTHNTLYGHSAGSGISTNPNSSDNVIVGYQAASGIGQADKNVIIGSQTATSLNAGDANVIIGYNAANEDNFTAGYNNVIIGTDAALNVVNDFDNSILIGTNVNEGNFTRSDTLYIGLGSTPLVEGSLEPSGLRYFNVNNGKIASVSRTDLSQLSFHTDYDTGYFYEQTIIGSDGGKEIGIIDFKDNSTTAWSATGGLAVVMSKADGVSGTLMTMRHDASPMSYSPAYVDDGRPYVEIFGDLRLLGEIKLADGSVLNGVTVSGDIAGTGIKRADFDGEDAFNLHFIDMPDATDAVSPVPANTSFVAVHVPSGSSSGVYRMSLSSFADVVESGFATISSNYNHMFTDNNNAVDVSKNNSTVNIGRGAGVASTGWKHDIRIGTDAGAQSTVTNANVNNSSGIDTSNVLIGNRAGYDADFITDTVFIGTNAGNNSDQVSDSIFVGTNAGLNSKQKASIGIGPNALSYETSDLQVGSGNIEIVTEYHTSAHNNERLFNGSGIISNSLNIGNVFAGNMSSRKLSVGNASLTPNSVLEVRHSSGVVPDGHDVDVPIQTWTSDRGSEAAVDPNGSGYLLRDAYNAPVLRPLLLEGVMQSGIDAPSAINSPTSGLMNIFLNGDFTSVADVVWVVNRDTNAQIGSGSYTMAMQTNGEYRPIYFSC